MLALLLRSTAHGLEADEACVLMLLNDAAYPSHSLTLRVSFYSLLGLTVGPVLPFGVSTVITDATLKK